MRRLSPTPGSARPRLHIAATVVALFATACGSSGLPAAKDSAAPLTTAPAVTSPSAESLDSGVPASSGDSETSVAPPLTVRGDLAGSPVDRRVFGTNVPAWLGPERLADPKFIELAKGSGATLLRMPGGSWSNYYDWSACENADDTKCLWPTAARPTDFIDFMQATGLPGLWTVSINATAQSAAAAVAFFNADVDDGAVIGVDREGVDWGTAGQWAELRASHGNPDPQPIRVWEVGNEVYGGKPESGGQECADFGWEDVWTCSGTAYVNGNGFHDGYRAIRAAMVAVDPAIEVGAVGVADPASWSNWGTEVIDAAGDDLDLYTVHQYGFDSSPDADEALARPAELWPQVIDGVRSALPVDVPIAVTEYNLVATEAGDTAAAMTRVLNALFVADSIGELVTGGVAVANQWNLANGTTPSGTDYGLIDVNDLSVFPQYRALALWSSTGPTLLTYDGDPPDGVHIYPTLRDDGSLAIVMINLGSEPSSFDITLDGTAPDSLITLTSWRTDDLNADDLISDAPVTLTSDASDPVAVTLPAWSLNMLEVGGGD